jgi:predicted nucleic acid-binding protein
LVSKPTPEDILPANVQSQAELTPPRFAPVADHRGRLLAEAKRPVPALDSLLAATAPQHEFRFLTRSTGDFRFAGLAIVNPWSVAE